MICKNSYSQRQAKWLAFLMIGVARFW